MNFSDVRAKYPQYDDMTDEALATALHSKYYSDMPFEEFSSKVGYSPASTTETFIEGAEQAGKGVLSGTGEFFENVAELGGGHVAPWSEAQATQNALESNVAMPTIPEYLSTKMDELSAWWAGEEAPEAVVAPREAYVPEQGVIMDEWRDKGKDSTAFAVGEFAGRVAPEVGAAIVNPMAGLATTFAGASPDEKTLSQSFADSAPWDNQYLQRAQVAAEDAVVGKILSETFEAGKRLFGGLSKDSTSALNQAGKQIDEAIAKGGDNASELQNKLVINGKETDITVGDAKIFREKAAISKILGDKGAPVSVQNIADQMDNKTVASVLGAKPTVQKAVSETVSKLPVVGDIAKRLGFLEGAASKKLAESVVEVVAEDADFYKKFRGYSAGDVETVKNYQRELANNIKTGDYDAASDTTKAWKNYINSSSSDFTQEDLDLLFKQNRKYKSMIEAMKAASKGKKDVEASTLAQAAGLYVGIDLLSAGTATALTALGGGAKILGGKINRKRVENIHKALEGKLSPEDISIISEALYFSPRFSKEEEED